MRAVIAVSLSGRAYQLEDDAHAALAQYLSTAERALAGNPDQAEILADLEQAIADKCERFLNPHKTVLRRAELEQVLGEMGPVDGGGEQEPAPHEEPPGASQTGGHAGAAATGAAHAAPRRLYQISEGALLSGVCKGISVYFDVDVSVVRLVFVIAAVLSGGLAVLVYLAMMFIVPYANTPEEVAAAGGLPFNARILVEQWKRKAAQFADAAAHAARMDGSPAERSRWRAEWRRARWQWRQEWRRSRAEWHAHRWGSYPWSAQRPDYAPPPLPPLAAFLSGLGWAVLGILVALVTLAWLFALLSLLATGAVFGWPLAHLPLWAAVVLLVVLYQLVVRPLRALRYAHSPYFYAYRYRAHALADALMGLLLLAALVWLLSDHMPAVQHLLELVRERVAQLWHQGVQAAPVPRQAAP